MKKVNAAVSESWANVTKTTKEVWALPWHVQVIAVLAFAIPIAGWVAGPAVIATYNAKKRPQQP